MSASRAQLRKLLEDPGALAAIYPSLAPFLDEPHSRRRMLKLMAASLAMAGLSACDAAAPEAELIPAVIAAPGIVPGRPNIYSSVSLAMDDPLGINVTHQMGRPIKVEGNPLHPASLGSTDAAAQALILDFYDPDRSAGILRQGDPASRPDLLTMLAGLRERHRTDRGTGLRILSHSMRSPSQGAAIDAVLARYPAARWHQWEPVSRDHCRGGALSAYGVQAEVIPRLGAADIILALDSDLLDAAPGHVRHARELATRRNPTRGTMSRIYAVEPTPSLIGAIADHRFITSNAELENIVAALEVSVLQREAAGPPWLAAIVADLVAHNGRALVHAGRTLSSHAQATVHRINEALGARGATMDVIASTEFRPVETAADGCALLSDMQAGLVETLVILEGNPVYAMPGFREALGRVALSIHHAPAIDETAVAAAWFVPRAHAFETWDDTRAFDGTASIVQPMARPLYGGCSPLELLSLLVGDRPVAPLAAVRAQWGALHENGWRDALVDGIVTGTAAATLDVKLKPATTNLPPRPVAPIELLFRPDPHIWDGRHANNAWLQELPRPLTKLVWDNPLLIAPALATKHALINGDEVEISIATYSVRMPVWIVPGQAPRTVIGLLGFGRVVTGEVGRGAGFDLINLRGRSGPVTLRKTGRHETLACTDHHNALNVRSPSIDPIVHHTTLASFNDAARPKPTIDAQAELYRRVPEGPVAWGMSIDLNSCIGCNACVVACQAENNVPVVGKQQVIAQREMHWLRIDRYYEGPVDQPQFLFQPMLCQHCEQAPCEVVCPVGATMHDQEGLNVMVYNRCIGTRFCSNNCPYKVRRFNYLAYVRHEQRPAVARNPDVSARSRGVMEKCTFCLQRIAEARIAHDRDGTAEEVQTACQAACPTHAFTFGDIARPDSEVAARKASSLSYAVLEDHGTHPRVTYETRVTNQNPATTA